LKDKIEKTNLEKKSIKKFEWNWRDFTNQRTKLKGGKTSNSNKKLRLNQRYVKKLGTKLKEKKVSTSCFTCALAWGKPVVFGWCLWCHQISGVVLFPIRQRASHEVYGDLDNPFFFPLSLSWPCFTWLHY